MLKKTIVKFMLFLSMILIFAVPTTGCAKEPEPTDDKTVQDYFPFNQNVKLIYEGQGNEFASYTTYVDFVTDDTIQIRSNNGGTESVSVIQSNDGALTEINSWGEMYYKVDLTNEPAEITDILLKEPLIEGTNWSLSDGSLREITGLSVTIETPYSSFDALEVTTTMSGEIVEKHYYAIDIGLVKSIVYIDEEEISSSLSEMVVGGGYDFTIRSFNFFVTDTDILSNFVDKEVSLKTGEEINNFLAAEFLEGGLISLNTKINQLGYKPGDKVANVDFSEEFITEMNAGTTKESGVLMSVANTIGNYYQVQEVVITVDGKPYSSGHILTKEGESFKTNYQNAVPD